MQVQRSKIGSGVCPSVVGCAGQNEERDQENDEGTGPGVREPYPDVRKVTNGSSVPACRARLLGAPSIHPVPVVFAMARKSVVNAKPQWAVESTEVTERTVGIRDGGRLKAWWQAYWGRGKWSSAPFHPVVAVTECCTSSKA